MPEELRFMLRSAAYSTFVGVAYWFFTQEAAGTVLLVGVGMSAAVMFGALLFEWRRSGHRLSGPPWRWALLPPADAESGTTNESGRLPRPSMAPLTAALGVALVALSLVFGIWMAVAGILPLLVALRLWLRDVMAEFRAVDSGE
jgi:uncharacterized membrane protein YedE/YeeE